MAFFLFNNNEQCKKLLEFRILKNLCAISSICATIYGLKYYSNQWEPADERSIQFATNLAACFSLAIFLLAIGSSNFTTNIWSESYFLKKCGKYSFGMYLLHPMFLNMNDWIKLKHDSQYLLPVLGLSYFAGFLFHYFIENPSYKQAIKICSRMNRLTNINSSDVVEKSPLIVQIN